jgi:hypothetical protein
VDERRRAAPGRAVLRISPADALSGPRIAGRRPHRCPSTAVTPGLTRGPFVPGAPATWAPGLRIAPGEPAAALPAATWIGSRVKPGMTPRRRKGRGGREEVRHALERGVKESWRAAPGRVVLRISPADAPAGPRIAGRRPHRCPSTAVTPGLTRGPFVPGAPATEAPCLRIAPGEPAAAAPTATWIGSRAKPEAADERGRRRRTSKGAV